MIWDLAYHVEYVYEFEYKTSNRFQKTEHLVAAWALDHKLNHELLRFYKFLARLETSLCICILHSVKKQKRVSTKSSVHWVKF